MKLIDITKQFNTEDKCLDYLEQLRWPNGVGCIECGSMNVKRYVREAKSKNKRTRIYQCLACGKQFSATSGTIFNDTHLPLTKWFMAVAFICEAKKGMSAMQVQRHLGVNYRTAWHLCHRIREAMEEGGILEGVVEADETFLRPRKPRKGNPKVSNPNRCAVLGMVERGGKLRLIPVRESHSGRRERFQFAQARHLWHVPSRFDKTPRPLLQRVFLSVQSSRGTACDV